MGIFSKKKTEAIVEPVKRKFKVGDLYRYSSPIDNSVGIIVSLEPTGYKVLEFISIHEVKKPNVKEGKGTLTENLLEYGWDRFMSLIDNNEYNTYVMNQISYFENEVIPRKEEIVKETKEKLAQAKETFAYLFNKDSGTTL